MTVPNSVVYNGNRSYTLTVNTTDLTSKLSPGMRLRTTRTVAAPTQCTNLNGTTQYFVKTSPNKLTFTDDFTVSAWVKLTAYGSNNIIASRFNNTSGWRFCIGGSGQVTIEGFNGGAANYRGVLSAQSIPLNKWVHVAAVLDMSALNASDSTTTFTYIDGVSVPWINEFGGTNPGSLVQAGNLEIGSNNGGTNLFNGKIAQVAIYSARISLANIQATISQGLTGSETSLASAYSFNNSITDLNTTTPNDLSVGGGSAVATNADSPFGGQASGSISSTLDYGIIMSDSFSTNTTVVVQVPEGCTIPTTGGVSGVSYSSAHAPYGLPSNRTKWEVNCYLLNQSGSVGSGATWLNWNSFKTNIPQGDWIFGYRGSGYFTDSANSAKDLRFGLSTAVQQPRDYLDPTTRWLDAGGVTNWGNTAYSEVPISLTIATDYYLMMYVATGTSVTFNLGQLGIFVIFCKNPHI